MKLSTMTIKNINLKPFVRWAGGKTQLLPKLLEFAPKQFNCYYEPFVGSGALYYALQPSSAVLNDTNSKLINAYIHVCNDVQSVISHLRTLERSKVCYYQQRELLNAEKIEQLDALSAARFIFLNKTCFNGLWRENAKGYFNVPYGGDRKRSSHVNMLNLIECSIRLRCSTKFMNLDFENAVSTAQEGDFVYFDPPYIPIKTSSFVDYTSQGFDYKQHLRLRDVATKLKSRGVQVMISNSDTQLTRQIYAEFNCHEVLARRNINRNASGRGKVGELIIT